MAYYIHYNINFGRDGLVLFLTALTQMHAHMYFGRPRQRLYCLPSFRSAHCCKTFASAVFDATT